MLGERSFFSNHCVGFQIAVAWVPVKWYRFQSVRVFFGFSVRTTPKQKSAQTEVCATKARFGSRRVGMHRTHFRPEFFLTCEKTWSRSDWDELQHRERTSRAVQDGQHIAFGANNGDRCDQRAAMFLGTGDAVALNFFGHRLPRAGRKSIAREKLGPVRHGKKTRDFAAARRVHHRFHQAVPNVVTMAARIGSDGERADFGQVGAVRLKCDATQQLYFFIPFFHKHEKMADVLTDFVLGTREQRTLSGVMRDHAMHGDRIGGASGAGPHGFTPSAARRSFAAAMASRTRPGAVPPSTSGPASAASRLSAS